MHLQLGETSQPVWVEFSATLNQIKDNDQEKNSLILMKSGVVSDDGQWVHIEILVSEIKQIYLNRVITESLKPIKLLMSRLCCWIVHRRGYFCTKNGTLVEIDVAESPR